MKLPTHVILWGKRDNFQVFGSPVVGQLTEQGEPALWGQAFEPLLGQGEGLWESLGAQGSFGGEAPGSAGRRTGRLADAPPPTLHLSVSWGAPLCCAILCPAVLCHAIPCRAVPYTCQPGHCTRSHQALGKAGRLPLPWHVGSVGWQGYGGDTPTLAPLVSSLGSSGESSNLPQRPRQHCTSSGGCVS